MTRHEKRRLLQRLQQLTCTPKRITHEAQSEAVSKVIDAGFDVADIAQAFERRTTNQSLAKFHAESRSRVEHALERLSDGVYGYCEDCAAEIPAERLRVQPEATRCVPCQVRWEPFPRMIS
jgi:DnaK suppressor protein